MTVDWRRIETEIEGLRVQSASLLGEGWNSWAFLVNGTHVFRLPKRDDVWDELEREIAFLQWSADRLPLKVPRYGHVARRSASAPHGYSVYGYMPGDALDIVTFSSTRRSKAADRLASFLRALHDLSLPPNLRTLIPHDDERAAIARCRERAGREIVPHLQTNEARALSGHFDSYFDAPETDNSEPAVVHADMSREHILMHGSAVSSVLDFGDVNIGDADYDFTYLFIDFGWPFVEDVARRYGHPDLDRLARKVRFFALVDRIDTILNGDGRAREGQIADAWRLLRDCLR